MSSFPNKNSTMYNQEPNNNFSTSFVMYFNQKHDNTSEILGESEYKRFSPIEEPNTLHNAMQFPICFQSNESTCLMNDLLYKFSASFQRVLEKLNVRYPPVPRDHFVMISHMSSVSRRVKLIFFENLKKLFLLFLFVFMGFRHL